MVLWHHVICSASNFASTGQLIVTALIQAMKLLSMAVTRLLYEFGLIALDV